MQRAAWIVRDNVIGKIVLISYSDARCPEHLQELGFEKQVFKFKVSKSANYSFNSHAVGMAVAQPLDFEIDFARNPISGSAA